MTRGKYRITNYKSIEIYELPIGTWTDCYKEFLEELCEDTPSKKKKDSKPKESIIKDYVNNSTESKVSFTIEFKQNMLKELLKDNRLEKELRLTTKISTTNMHLFNHKCQIQKYTTHEIMDEFYMIRYQFYVQRKEHMLKTLEQILKVLNEKVRFINDVINEEIIINKRSKDDINQQLEQRQYLKVDDEYKYLVSMPIYSLSSEKKEELENEAAKKNEEFNELQGTSIETMWKSELKEFQTKYKEFLSKKEKEQELLAGAETKTKKKITRKKNNHL